MTEPTLHFTPCADPAGGHRMASWRWGSASAPHVIVCVHGLTRQGRDFDELARALLAAAPAGALQVICPDVVGRGQSDWLRDPGGYQLPQYAADMLALLQERHAAQPIATLDYLGTSMGGMIGMVLAGHAELSLPVALRRLVLNDVGPAIDAQAIERIAAYVGQAGQFVSRAAAYSAMAAISVGFGPHTPAQWAALSEPMVVPAALRSVDGLSKVEARPDGDDAAAQEGPFVLHYDPQIALALRAMTPAAMAQGEALMWSIWDAIQARTLLLRGAESDLLSPATAAAMVARGPHAQLVEFPGVGHAPTLVTADQRAPVVQFLLSP